MSAEGSSVKVSSQQSPTSFPKVKGEGPLFSGLGPLITEGLVNDTTLAPPTSDWRCVQTFSFEDSPTTGADTWWLLKDIYA